VLNCKKSYLFAVALAVSTLVPFNAMAGFSTALAVSRTADKREVSYPQIACAADVIKANDGSTTLCILQFITDTGRYCAFIAKGFSQDVTWWTRARIPILVISVAGTALGVSSISSAKSWAAVGGTSGIASGWNSDSTSASTGDQASLSKISTAAAKLASLDPTKLTSISAANDVAVECQAAAGTAQSNSK
jgi:hypothetical protein